MVSRIKEYISRIFDTINNYKQKKYVLYRHILILICVGLLTGFVIAIYNNRCLEGLLAVVIFMLLFYYKNKFFTKVHIIRTKNPNAVNLENFFEIKSTGCLKVSFGTLKTELKNKKTKTFCIPKHIFNPLIVETDDKTYIIDLTEEDNEIFLLIKEENNKNNSQK